MSTAGYVLTRGLIPLAVVMMFGFAPLAFAAGEPTVTTDAATSVVNGTAVLNATINALGTADVTTRGFEYGLTTAYGSTTEELSVLAPFAAEAYSTAVTGLLCGRTYHFRAYAASLTGPGYGADATVIFGCNKSKVFMPLPVAPVDVPTVDTDEIVAPPPALLPAPPVPSPLDEAFPVVQPNVSRDASGHLAAPDSGLTGFSPFDGTLTEISQVSAGWFIRAPNYSSVYYVTPDLHRRPFPDVQTFFTWAKSFDDVVWVTDATLSTLPLDGPMLPHAGVVLVKVQGNRGVYVIEAQEDGSSALRLIPTEGRAVFLFGSNWAKYVLDIPPTLFHLFQQGADVYPFEMFSRTLMKMRSLLQ